VHYSTYKSSKSLSAELLSRRVDDCMTSATNTSISILCADAPSRRGGWHLFYCNTVFQIAQLLAWRPKPVCCHIGATKFLRNSLSPLTKSTADTNIPDTSFMPGHAEAVQVFLKALMQHEPKFQHTQIYQEVAIRSIPGCRPRSLCRAVL